MAPITDNDLKELKDLITENQKKVETRLDKLEDKVETKLDKLEEKIDRLSEGMNELKVEVGKNQQNIAGLDKRLSNIEFTNRGIFISLSTGLVIARLGAFTKFLFFNPNL